MSEDTLPDLMQETNELITITIAFNNFAWGNKPQ